MDKAKSSMAQQNAQAEITFDQRRTGNQTPKSVSVVLSEGALVSMLHDALSPAEKELAKTPAGAAQMQEFHRQLFAGSSEPTPHRPSQVPPAPRVPRRRIVLTTFGSLGDLHPYLAIALGLQERGHEVVLATSACYREKVESLGVGFRAVRPDQQDWLARRDEARRVMDLHRGTEYVLRTLLLPALRDSYDDLLTAADGADLLVSHPLTYAARLVVETKGLPWASTMLSPIGFFSAHDPPALPGAPFVSWLRFLGPPLYKNLFRVLKLAGRSWARPWYRLRPRSACRRRATIPCSTASIPPRWCWPCSPNSSAPGSPTGRPRPWSPGSCSTTATARAGCRPNWPVSSTPARRRSCLRSAPRRCMTPDRSTSRAPSPPGSWTAAPSSWSAGRHTTARPCSPKGWPRSTTPRSRNSSRGPP